MNLVRARRTVLFGQYVYPASFLIILVVVVKWPLPGVVAAFVAILCLWGSLLSFSRWIGHASDERMELKEQLIQSQKLLALGEISTGIAHEINNPLNIIMQEAELMRMNFQQDLTEEEVSEIQESLDVILQQVERCSDITHKLLDFARSRRPVTQTADMNRLLVDMLTLVERETDAKHIQIVKVFSNDLPKIKTDPPLLRQVFLNLLINAVQALDGGGLIFVTTQCNDGMVCAEIRDTGPGISAAQIERVFDPFYTTKPPGEGTGLGLSVSLRIINQLGGDILLRSEPGKGAVFTVRIPIER
ncbi:MAG: two-component sensor histidine kinase [Pseudodesulfovibrio sp.]|nr:two-component sensor histidine kinase [Pseudodesulfovibrio sp.]